MKNLLYIPIVVLLLSCGGTKQPVAYSNPEEQAVYEVLNFCLNSGQVAKGEKVLADETVRYGSALSDWPYPDNDERFLTKEDLAFMRIQEADSIPFTIDPIKLSRPVKMASYKKLRQWLAESEKTGLEAYWEQVYAEYGRGYATFSRPLFSKDYKTAVISYGNHCGGLCGGGATYILQKDVNGWKIVDVYNRWIS